MKRRTIMLTALLVLVLILSGCSSLTGNSVISTVSVSASASKEVAPDTATFSITAESTKPSTEEARNDSATMINKAVEILKDEYGISDDSLTTDFMMVSPYYEWLDGGRTLVGQKATQKLSIVLSGENLSKGGKVYDRLSVLDGISISSVSYSKLDTTEEVRSVREKAAEEALKKAEAYAKGVGKKVGEVISITDGSGVSYTTVTYNSPKLMMAEASMDYASTTIYQSDVTLSDSVTVLFTLID